MPAYVIVEIDVHDPVRYEDYKARARPLVEKYGGRYVARGGAAFALEGPSPAGRVVVLEFPSAEQARVWWDSPEYAPVRQIRQETATSRMIVVEGLPPA